MHKKDKFHEKKEEWSRVTDVLMCPPKYFRIEFKINPYMNPSDPRKQVNKHKALSEWKSLYAAIKRLRVRIHLLNPEKGVPDMVFPADLGFIVNPKICKRSVILSNFKWPERQKETKYYEKYLKTQKYKPVRFPSTINYEINVRETDNFYLLGYGIRNDLEGIKIFKKYSDKPVYSLRLINPWFYHMSCALAILNNDTVLYYPAAFDMNSNKLVKKLFKIKIIMTKSEAINLTGNCIVINGRIIINDISRRLENIFDKLGLIWERVELDEFRKAGGAANCMVFVLSKKWQKQVFS
jgi:N-dimethylarginine dimethylaminohydrolase